MINYLLIFCLILLAILATHLFSRIYFQNKLQQLEGNWSEAKMETIRLHEMIKSRDQQLSSNQASLIAWETKLQKEFSILADNVLERKARQFNDQQEYQMNALLNPLKDTIRIFKDDMNAKFTEEIRDKGSLKEEIAKLLAANQNISKQAQDLSQALRGSAKMQGDWGETILDSILEFAGLREGINYTKQIEEKTDEGLRIRPDIRIKLPQDRYLIIDSKVTLANYWDYCGSENLENQENLVQRLVRSFKLHIDSLHNKVYIDIGGTPDFLIMFVPVEPAYIIAMQHDIQLWQYAYSKKVLLISPTNLIPALKMVSDMWKREAVNQNAQAIAVQAAKLYDKLAGFIENFEKTGAQISAAGRAFENSRKQLISGKGNIVAQAEKLRNLHLQTNKIIPGQMADEALLAENLGEFYSDESSQIFSSERFQDEI